MKGDKSQVSNYRLISLLTGFCKILEVLIFYRLKYHLLRNNILANEHFGFHVSVSTESAIFELKSIFNVWNNKKYIKGLFCDLTKAFGSVRHELLILKLEFYGVKGSILNWLKYYLYNRKQRVVL